jgi:hypothetical protein
LRIFIKKNKIPQMSQKIVMKQPQNSKLKTAKGGFKQAAGSRQQAAGNYTYFLDNRVNYLIVRYFHHPADKNSAQFLILSSPVRWIWGLTYVI